MPPLLVAILTLTPAADSATNAKCGARLRVLLSSCFERTSKENRLVKMGMKKNVRQV